ncbi:AfsR/SARP family transcriptional regulator [Dictyobacter formicarum]|uniref:Bacterial transcriptional activator domain-containing protein n=1 Tax=Dictyobacter formicarum TaxID=2778368 RepID=A0ABQ3VPM4_9CHLR|nr:BTAD domain-containing putative transcriptional regulator [Dictyobacter formicarum]GHO87636.1 hypothetical protein KSZ_56420 [Dictyobacter formicarum]
MSLESLLIRGSGYIQQGNLTGGVTLLALACEQLSSDQGHFATEFTALQQECTNYLYALHALQEASEHFTRVHTALREKVANFTTIASKLLNGIDAFPLSLSINEQDQSATKIQKHSVSASASAGSRVTDDSTGLPPLFITCLGPFEVRQQDNVLPLCSSYSGRRILRYLIAQSGYRASSDTLQTLLWPEDEPEVAQRKLHSAISALRRALHQGQVRQPGNGYVVYKQRSYALNPATTICTDVDEFLQLYQTGKQGGKEQVTCYEQACLLYNRPFLMEDVYEDWSSLQREQLSRVYFTMCQTLTEHYLAQQCYDDATKWATAVLKENPCNEAAHRQLMQIYACQGRRSEALQQYQRCKRILHEELTVQPLPETTCLFHTLLANDTLVQDEEKM